MIQSALKGLIAEHCSLRDKTFSTWVWGLISDLHHNSFQPQVFPLYLNSYPIKFSIAPNQIQFLTPLNSHQALWNLWSTISKIPSIFHSQCEERGVYPVLWIFPTSWPGWSQDLPWDQFYPKKSFPSPLKLKIYFILHLYYHWSCESKMGPLPHCYFQTPIPPF